MRALMILAAAWSLAACGETASERQARDELERIAEEREREEAAAEQEAAEHLMTFGLVGAEPDQAGAAGPAADLASQEPAPPSAGVSDAERFVRWLYAGVASGEIELNSPEDADSVWTVENARIFHGLGDGDRALLTVNPLCACGDARGVRVRSVEITPTGSTTARALVEIAGGGRDEIELMLVRETAGWRLADVPGA